jgi:hypothetical protein
MENPLKPDVGLHHVPDSSRVKPCTQHSRPWPNEWKSYDLYRKRFLWRFARIRLRRLCFEIFALRLFFREPIYRGICAGDVDPNTKRVQFQLVVMNKQRFSQMTIRPGRTSFNENYARNRAHKIRTELAPA